jgi:MarR family transcriptional regulator, organic hydroperoxide resistance regulator
VSSTDPAKTAPAGASTIDADPPDALRQLGRSFKRAMAAVRRLRGRETRRPGELSDAQYGLLFGLRDHAELSTSELALSADLSPATTTEMLDALEAAGLVRRARSQRDRRVVLTSLTERGHELVAERHARYEPRWRAAFEEFSEDELRAASAVLERMAEMFDELAENPPDQSAEPPGPPRA